MMLRKGPTAYCYSSNGVLYIKPLNDFVVGRRQATLFDQVPYTNTTPDLFTRSSIPSIPSILSK